MKYIFLNILLGICLLGLGQGASPFHLQHIDVKNFTEWKTLDSFVWKSAFFYEDEDYTVRTVCGGEWGGRAYFKSKRTGTEYKCDATCPVSIYRINGKYIVTNTLRHLSGHGDVLEVKDPSLLKPDTFRSTRRLRYNVADTIYSKFVNRLVDSFRITILGSFPYKDTMYYIISSDKGTFLSILSENKFHTIDIILPNKVNSEDPQMLPTKEGHFVMLYHLDRPSGYIDVFEDTIKVIW